MVQVDVAVPSSVHGQLLDKLRTSSRKTEVLTMGIKLEVSEGSAHAPTPWAGFGRGSTTIGDSGTLDLRRLECLLTLLCQTQ